MRYQRPGTEVGGGDRDVCGLAGVWSSILPPEDRERLVRAMLSRMPERGPDAQTIFHCDDLTLGFLRLAIVGQEGAAQPVQTARAVSMMNGEVYNYLTLWNDLPEKVRLSVGLASDCSVLAPLFEVRSTSFLESLDGIFAGVVYDRLRRTLHLFRDHVGVKPLFYTHRPDAFLLASTVAALAPLVSPALDRVALRRYLACGYVQTPRTLLSGVRSVRPGGLLSLADPRTKGVERTWFARVTNISGVRRSLEDAVRSEIPDGWPVVSTLSGGVDSTLLTLLLQRFEANPTALTVRYPSSADDDDLRTARLISVRYGIPHVEVPVTPEDYYTEVASRWRFDQPLADPNAIALNRLCQQTRALGSRVLITGDGSDELFCGYEYYRAGVQGTFRSRIAASAFDSMTDWKDRLFVRRITGRPCLRRVRPGRGDPVLRMQQHDLQNWLEPNLLAKSDRFGMADQVEVRVPFLRPDVVRLALSLPPHLKISRHETKVVLKAAFADLLPDFVTRRAKVGFPCPIGDWLRRDLGHELRQQASWAVGDAWDVQREGALWREHLRGIADWGQQLWRLAVARAWWRSVAD